MSIRTKIYTTLYVVLGASALGSLSAPALADPSPPSKKVRFNDLDLSTPKGAKILYDRISAAAHDVCGTTDPIMRQATRECIAHAIDQAVKDVNAPMLTSLRFGTPEVRLARK